MDRQLQGAARPDSAGLHDAQHVRCASGLFFALSPYPLKYSLLVSRWSHSTCYQLLSYPPISARLVPRILLAVRLKHRGTSSHILGPLRVCCDSLCEFAFHIGFDEGSCQHDSVLPSALHQQHAF